MPTLVEKLNLKDQDEIVVVNSPPSFETELAGLSDVSVVRFRRVEFIKSMKRNPRHALSPEGKKRTSST